MAKPIQWETSSCLCCKEECQCPQPCPCCPGIPCDPCEAEPKFTLARIPPVCRRPYCCGPIVVPPCSCMKRHRCRPLPSGYQLASGLCPALSGRAGPCPRLNKWGESPTTETRCDTEHGVGEPLLTGYKTIGYAMGIPGWTGFRPRFPHPLPKLPRLPGCPDHVPAENNTYCCPEGCKLCTPVEPGKPALCVAQVHPYISFNQADKIIRTW